MYTKVERNLTVKASCTFFELEKSNLCHKEVLTLLQTLKKVKNTYCKQIMLDKFKSKYNQRSKKWLLKDAKWYNPLKIEIIKNV